MSSSNKQVLAMGLVSHPKAKAAFPNIEEIIKDDVLQASKVGFDLVPLDVNPDEADCLDMVKGHLQSRKWDVISIGYGVRGTPDWTASFETMVNMAVQESEGKAKLLFPLSPLDLIPALQRNFTV